MSSVARQKGRFNSSLTRVYPFFSQLIERDPTGLSWLSTILEHAIESVPDAVPLPHPIGSLLPEVVAKRIIGGNILRYYGVDSIELPSCFEKSMPPSDGFLRWLIEHPEKLEWPDHGKARFGQRAQSKREDLIGLHGPERQKTAQQEALTELDEKGVARAHGKWWSFEGTTSVDCFLETGNLVLLIEGKRTEPLSESVNWYPGRNQLVRNLDVAQELAGEKSFAVLVIAEEDIGSISQEVVEKSLPHFTPHERQQLMQHYLGCLTWEDVCQVTGIEFTDLPETVAVYVNDWI